MYQYLLGRRKEKINPINGNAPDLFQINLVMVRQNCLFPIQYIFAASKICNVNSKLVSSS